MGSVTIALIEARSVKTVKPGLARRARAGSRLQKEIPPIIEPELVEREDLVRKFAPIVFEAMRWAAKQPRDGNLPPPWYNGNSFAEERARLAVREMLALGATELTALEEKVRRLEGALRELHAIVLGECPSLLDEDCGGSADLDCEIEELLALNGSPNQ